MGNKVTLGGERLGSGKEMQVDLQEFNRTTVDLGFTWRSTMSPGTLVPFMKEIALPGDTHEISLNTDVLTHPTIGPLFGSYKVQLDVFSVPMGLYQAEMIQNALNIGLKMENVKMPIMTLNAGNEEDREQISPSTLLNHLDIRGVGRINSDAMGYRKFNAIPMLAYWDIFKCYYANKQEDEAYYIKTNIETYKITNASFYYLEQDVEDNGGNTELAKNDIYEVFTRGVTSLENMDMKIDLIFSPETEIELDQINAIADRIEVEIEFHGGQGRANKADYVPNRGKLNDYYDKIEVSRTASNTVTVIASKIYAITSINAEDNQVSTYVGFREYPTVSTDNEPTLKKFPLENIDKMRKRIIKTSEEGAHFDISENEGLDSLTPYVDINNMAVGKDGKRIYGKQYGQELLAVKTYQSDLFNNWLNTEWLDGENGINEITKINVDDGLKINDLILHKKIFDMLNNIAISGGSYDNWLNAVYNQERQRGIHSPLYHGGLIKELTFDEVISNSATEDQPLGTLAGRGVLTNKHKGGYIKVKTDEPSYIIGIISLTPRVDYSQGNKWDVNLMTWDDFHKPQLDGIGFQDLLTDQMDYRSTEVQDDGHLIYRSAGKQPAWINYQTNINVVKGNFAVETEQMFMTLNRRYETDEYGIKDMTTYIDPAKFNHIFAYTRRDAQNFWAQIKVDMRARRKMSAKIIPNL